MHIWCFESYLPVPTYYYQANHDTLTYLPIKSIPINHLLYRYLPTSSDRSSCWWLDRIPLLSRDIFTFGQLCINCAYICSMLLQHISYSSFSIMLPTIQPLLAGRRRDRYTIIDTTNIPTAIPKFVGKKIGPRRRVDIGPTVERIRVLTVRIKSLSLYQRNFPLGSSTPDWF